MKLIRLCFLGGLFIRFRFLGGWVFGVLGFCMHGWWMGREGRHIWWLGRIKCFFFLIACVVFCLWVFISPGD